MTGIKTKIFACFVTCVLAGVILIVAYGRNSMFYTIDEISTSEKITNSISSFAYLGTDIVSEGCSSRMREALVSLVINSLDFDAPRIVCVEPRKTTLRAMVLAPRFDFDSLRLKCQNEEPIVLWMVPYDLELNLARSRHSIDFLCNFRAEEKFDISQAEWIEVVNSEQNRVLSRISADQEKQLFNPVEKQELSMSDGETER